MQFKKSRTLDSRDWETNWPSINIPHYQVMTFPDLVGRVSISLPRRSSSLKTAMEDIGTSLPEDGCSLSFGHPSDHLSHRQLDDDNNVTERNTACTPSSPLFRPPSTSPGRPDTPVEINDDSFVTACSVTPGNDAAEVELVKHRPWPSPFSDKGNLPQRTPRSNTGTAELLVDVQSGSIFYGLGEKIPFENRPHALPGPFWGASRSRDRRNPCQGHNVKQDMNDILLSVKLPGIGRPKDTGKCRQNTLTTHTKEQEVSIIEAETLALFRKTRVGCHPCKRRETILCGVLSRLTALPRNIRVRIQLHIHGVTPSADSLDEAGDISIPVVPREYGPQKNENASPREFLKMTSAEKKAFYSSPSMNRIISGSAPSTGTLLLHPLNDRIDVNPSEPRYSTGTMNLAAFKQFCTCQASSCTTIAAHLQLWNPAEFATSTDELRHYGSLPYETYQLNPELVRNTKRLLESQQQKVRRLTRLCGDWETAMRELPRSVKRIFICAEVPRLCCPKELSICLWRLQTYAMWRSGRAVGWSVDFSREGG